MDDMLDLLAVYNQFEYEPAAMALEIIRLRRELLATTPRLLSHEIAASLNTESLNTESLSIESLNTESLGDQALAVERQADCRVPAARQEPGHQVTQLPNRRTGT